MGQRKRIEADIEAAEPADLAALERIAAGSGPVADADIRELARVLAVVARGGKATVALLQQLGSAGTLRALDK